MVMILCRTIDEATVSLRPHTDVLPHTEAILWQRKYQLIAEKIVTL
jgi:hypothetical protein